MPDPKEYTVGWICAISIEYVAAQSFLDDRHDGPEYLSPNNKNDYTLGRIGRHNVVISVLPMGSYGSASAAQVAENMLLSFPNVRIGLMVGIGGGVPYPHDIRLGDVVVSIPSEGRSGVIQYDIGKLVQGQGFQPMGFLDQPPTVLRAAVNGMIAKYEIDGHELKESVEAILASRPRLRRKYKRPQRETDRLYKSDSVHPTESPDGFICAHEGGDGVDCLILRNARPEDEDDPMIHYGSIASANQLMNDALIRDKIAREKGVLCFEMEAAGLMNNFPCLVIRGICDYSDSHQEEYSEWRGYAAMTAAAYAKDLLNRMSSQNVEQEQKILDALKISIDHVVENTDHIVQMTDHVAETTDRMAQGLTLDKLPFASGAAYDSYADQYEPGCLEGTRKSLLEEIHEWAFSQDGKCLFWLNGMAGTGKSTISRTVARSLKENLGASFFFKRGEEDRGNAKKLFPTLVHQLVLQYPVLFQSVRKALEVDPNLASKSLGEQFNQLILSPLVDLDRTGQQGRNKNLVIVLDALDECDQDRDVRSVIRLLPQLRKVHSFQTRVFLTSRPELPVRLGFQTIESQDYTDLVLHDIPEEVTKHDISLFLNHRFTHIRNERDVPSNWPSERTINELVAMSIPLFISAATVCRYIEHSKLDPTERLQELLQDQSRYATKMERTYMPILNRLVNDIESEEAEQQEILDNFQRIIGVIVLLAIPLPLHSLSKLLNISIRSIHTHLDSFQSVLSVPSVKEDNRVIRILHLSFRDFLLSSPDNRFHINEPQKHKEIAGLCFEIMKSYLKKNICNLPSVATDRASIDPQVIRSRFPPELEYACRYWVTHFESSEISETEADRLLVFLKKHLLHWLEAMSLLGHVSDAVGIINRLQFATQNEIIYSQNENLLELSAFVKDAGRFVLLIHQVINDAPLQIYCSGLIFAPVMSIVRREFERDIPLWIGELPQVESEWSQELQTLFGHSKYVTSVAVSPDGRLMASGSQDKTVLIWDTTTWEIQETIKGPGMAEAVVFSPDGRLVMGAFSDDHYLYIVLFDLISGDLERKTMCEGHDGHGVLSSEFSPDGRLLAARHTNEVIRLWVVETCQLYREFRGMPRRTSVAFSPNGKILAFSSTEYPKLEVQVWDLIADKLEHTIQETHQSFSDPTVAISPDNRLLAFGIGPNIQIWDLILGGPKRILLGPDGSVCWLIFSSDGSTIVSCSVSIEDTSLMQIWDTATGKPLHTIGRNSLGTSSMVFLPGKQLIATGHSNNMIKIWDAAVCRYKESLEGHDGEINSLAFSPDGEILASGSRDYTVRFWDTKTGSMRRAIYHGIYEVYSLVFSQDGKKLGIGHPGKGSSCHPCIFDLEIDVMKEYDCRLKDDDQFGVPTIAFSSDGELLGSIRNGDTNKVDLLNIERGEIQGINFHNMPVLDESWGNSLTPIALSRDCRWLAVSESDLDTTTVQLWDTETGNEVLHWNLRAASHAHELAFSHDDSYLYTQDGTVLDIDLPSPLSSGEGRGMRISVVEKWLQCDGERVMWLGSRADLHLWRPRGNVLALGHKTGWVSFVRLEPCLQESPGLSRWRI